MQIGVVTLLTALAWRASAAPPQPDARGFTVFDMPEALAGPCDMETGPDGAIWTQYQLDNKLARIDPETGQIDEYEIPWTLPVLDITLPNILGRAVLACVVRTGADGYLYAANGVRNQLVKMNVHTKHIDVITPPNYNPLGNLQPFNDLYTGPDGMYFTETTNNVIRFYEYATGNFKTWTVPTAVAAPLGIYYASDNKVYFLETAGQKVGRLDPATGNIEEFQLPLNLLGPGVVRAETEGRYVWFTSVIGNALGRIDMQTGQFKAYPDDLLLALPAEDTVDGDGNVWYSTFNQNLLNRIDGVTGKLTYITMPGTLIPAPVSLPYNFDVAIHYDAGRNSIWYSNELLNRVGRYQL